MGWIQNGPKAAVGGMQYREAPPGAARSLALAGRRGPVSTTSSRGPQPWVVGCDPGLSCPIGQPGGSWGGR